MVCISSVGSRKSELHEIALRVFSLSNEYQIRLEPEWVPKYLIEKADFLSGIPDYDDWYINPEVFAWSDMIWDPHTIEGFADCNKYQLPHFNSRCWNPGPEVVDTFTTDWSGENNRWCPPVSLVPRVIGHADACMAIATLILPEWMSAPCWPLLHPSADKFACFVSGVQEFPLSKSLFLLGLSGFTWFHDKMPNTRVLAVCCGFARMKLQRLCTSGTLV